MCILVELVIFVIKLILLQTTHILQHLTTFYQNTHNILSKHTQIFSQSYDQSPVVKVVGVGHECKPVNVFRLGLQFQVPYT